MSVNFKFCGKLNKLKEKENFKPLELKKFSGGFARRTLKFQGVNGNNKHFLQISASLYVNDDDTIDEKKTQIYTFENATGDEKKAKQIKVDYDERFDPEIVKKVPNFRKFVIDLNQPDATEKNEKLRHEYIFENDFIDAMNKLLSKEEISEKKFYITGSVDCRYSDKDKEFYRTFSVQRVYLAKETDEERMELSGSFIYGGYSWDEDAYDETGRVKITVWNKMYDGSYKNDSCKGNVAVPFDIMFIPEGLANDKATPEQLFSAYRRRLAKVPDDSEYGVIDITFDAIDGAQVEKITYDDLPEDVREDIDMGLADLETELKKAGGTAYGDRITEYRLKSARNAKASEYGDEDVALPVHDAVPAGEKPASVSKPASDDDDDLFDI